MDQQVTFIATRTGPVFVGEVIDLGTQRSLLKTAPYASAETAKSAATSMWRAQMALQDQFGCREVVA